jgi:hypothetical protein
LLGEMFQNALYAQGNTRGLRPLEAKNYATRMVTWRAMEREPRKQ